MEQFKGKFRSVLLFGAPGSGKGTQARFLCEVGGHVHLSTGDVFRGLSRESPAGKLFAAYAGKGKLVPDDVTLEIWHNYVLGLIATNRYFPETQLLLLDGIPRTEMQVELLDEYVEIRRIIVLETKDLGLFVERLKRRAMIEKRFDDADEEVLGMRMQVYAKETANLLEKYPKELITRVDATKSPIEVVQLILNACIGDLIT